MAEVPQPTNEKQPPVPKHELLLKLPYDINLYTQENRQGILTPHLDKIQRIAIDITGRIQAVMPITDVEIEFSDRTDHVIDQIGLGGQALSGHDITIFLDPDHPDFTPNLDGYLDRLIAEEIHHAKRTRHVKNCYRRYLLGSLVTEGLANNFVVEVTGKKPAMWNTALLPPQLAHYRELATAELFDPRYNHNAWFFGRDSDIPRWTGYTLGFDLVRGYLGKHPTQKASKLYAAPAEQFIE